MIPNLDTKPDIKVSIKQTFGIDSEMEVDAFSKKSEYVPDIDKNYKFDKDTTLAIISGFAFSPSELSDNENQFFEGDEFLKYLVEPQFSDDFSDLVLVLQYK